MNEPIKARDLYDRGLRLQRSDKGMRYTHLGKTITREEFFHILGNPAPEKEARGEQE